MTQNKMPADHKVAIIGAGFSGLGIAMELRRAGLRDFVVIDRRDDIGGVWYANSYPGLACDIPALSYSFSSEPNPDWSRMYAPRDELREYADRITDKHDLRPHLRLNTEVRAATWDQDRHLWRLDTDRGELTARFVVMASGLLTTPRRPDIPGLDSFAGKLMHTAEWVPDHDLSGRRVGVIGTGASGLQVIPEIAPEVERLHVYQRTPIWVIPKYDQVFSDRAKRLFRRLPVTQRAGRAFNIGLNELFLLAAIIHETQAPYILRMYEDLCRKFLEQQVPDDPDLRERLTPKYKFGCKRASFSNIYLSTFTRDNVELEDAGIERVEPSGIVTRDGRRQELDTLVLATGYKVFDYDNLPPYRVTGKDGVDLHKFWRERRYHAYEGISLPQLPNAWMVIGPYSYVGNNWFLTIEYQSIHLLRCLKEARRRDATYVAVRQEPTDRFFNDILRRQRNGVLFNHDCSGSNSYYFDPHGDAPLMRPTSSFQAFRRARSFSIEDYEFGSLR